MKKSLKFSDFIIVGSNSLRLIAIYHLPMQYVLCAFNLLIINMVLCAKIASGDKRGTKICRPKEKKSKYEIQFCTLQNKPMHGVFILDLLLTKVAK